jgi:hypothetical protein
MQLEEMEREDAYRIVVGGYWMLVQISGPHDKARWRYVGVWNT